MYPALVITHICGAVIGMLSGGLSMIFRKGSGLHRAAGNIFFVSMVVMASSGAYLAAFIKPNRGNVMGGVLTLYVVTTGWVAGKRRERRIGIFDWAALTVVLGLVTVCATWGIQARISPTGRLDGYPPFLFFIFGSIASLFAAADIRMIARKGIEGGRRLARHLVRMCSALLFALFSFYPARAHLFSKAINASRVMYVPHILIVGSLLFWLARVRVKRRKSVVAPIAEVAHA